MDIFCKIVKGNEKSYPIFETTHVLVILDIQPQSTGHTLIIPKNHFETVESIPDEIYCQMFLTARIVGDCLKKVFGYETYRILAVVGKAQDIPHAHIHIIGVGNTEIDKNDLPKVQNKMKIELSKKI